jgi:hypothetical protein
LGSSRPRRGRFLSRSACRIRGWRRFWLRLTLRRIRSRRCLRHSQVWRTV